jgi:hypothetical protein
MTKKDIKAGDIVLLKDGRQCIVMPNIHDPNKELALYGVLNLRNPFLVGCDKSFGIITSLNNYYNDDLTTLDDDVYTIMAVRKNPITSAYCLFEMLTNKNIDKDRYYWDWKREEVKEVTMAEIEEKFGCKVKIVKEESDG